MTSEPVRLDSAILLADSPSSHHAGVVETRRFERLPSDHGTVLRCSMTATVDGSRDVVVHHVPTLRMTLDPGDWTAHWFVSDWGDEFTPRSQVLAAEDLRLEVRTGRSSKGCHPWLALCRHDGATMIVSPAWSGNWQITVSRNGDDGYVLSAGISDWGFSRRVTATRPFEAPDVVVASAIDRMTAGAALAQAASIALIPSNKQSSSMSVAWNHWWPYEDAEISAEVFLANAHVAAQMGLDQVTLDAGWFGPSDATSFWERVRGDWHRVNGSRFPDGLNGLSRQVGDLGLEFGLWVEAEAVGPDAEVARERPEIMARRDASDETGEEYGDLGYVCLGSEQGRAHILDTVDRLVRDHGCRWIKWDFNLDPRQGCTRTDHGHDSGDGLYEHYRGLYAVLDRIRLMHPDLILEGCSSGGLRIDLGLLSHLHTTFLSDPDWTEFHTQLLWGASQMLPAAAIFHFSESEWRTFHPLQNLHPSTLSDAEIDVVMRAVSLHRFALSYRLVDMSEQIRDRIRDHVTTFRDVVAPIVADRGVIRPLTDQPLREGGGCRFPAFQLTSGQRHVVTAIRLEGAEAATVVFPVGLDAIRPYRMRLVGPGADARDLPRLTDVGGSFKMNGAEIMAGVAITSVSGARSWMLEILPIDQPQDS